MVVATKEKNSRAMEKGAYPSIKNIMQNTYCSRKKGVVSTSRMKEKNVGISMAC